MHTAASGRTDQHQQEAFKQPLAVKPVTQGGSPVKLQGPHRTPSPVFQLHATAGPANPADPHTATPAVGRAPNGGAQPQAQDAQPQAQEAQLPAADGAAAPSADKPSSWTGEAPAPQAKPATLLSAAAVAPEQPDADAAALEARARVEAGMSSTAVAVDLSRCSGTQWSAELWQHSCCLPDSNIAKHGDLMEGVLPAMSYVACTALTKCRGIARAHGFSSSACNVAAC